MAKIYDGRTIIRLVLISNAWIWATYILTICGHVTLQHSKSEARLTNQPHQTMNPVIETDWFNPVSEETLLFTECFIFWLFMTCPSPPKSFQEFQPVWYPIHDHLPELQYWLNGGDPLSTTGKRIFEGSIFLETFSDFRPAKDKELEEKTFVWMDLGWSKPMVKPDFSSEWASFLDQTWTRSLLSLGLRPACWHRELHAVSKVSQYLREGHPVRVLPLYTSWSGTSSGTCWCHSEFAN